ncbi:MAG TPA: phosphoribulokinase [Verrucomicrobiae bacterium]|nr:phosphoribulokinase [Verrucomicrobiae bacterium]
MSAKFPIIAVTGSSGAGTSRTRPLFERLFAQMNLRAACVEGDSFHAYDREQMLAVLHRARIRGENFSHFGPAANLLERLEQLFEEFGELGSGRVRQYLHTEAEARAAGSQVGAFTPWSALPVGTEVLFYEGLHGGVVTDEHDVARHVDLLVGMTPTVNLEWIQKIRRDTDERGYDPAEVLRTILRRMPDYANYIAPQFSRTDVNFQRVPLIDTSNPFMLQDIPKPEESLLVIHLNRKGRIPVEFDELLADLPGAFLSREDTLVVPGEHMEAAMEEVLGPAVRRLVEGRA